MLVQHRFLQQVFNNLMRKLISKFEVTIMGLAKLNLELDKTHE